MALFASDYQGGHYFDIFTPQGSSPLNNWKLSGLKHVRKVYDKSVKGYVFSCTGGLGTKMQLPKDERRSMTLLQPFLVVQLQLSIGQPFSLEISVSDDGGTRRRLYLSSAFTEVKITPLHCQLPLSGLPRGSWLNLTVNVAALVSACFSTSFRSVDLMVLSAVCKLRRVFTLRYPPVASHQQDDGAAGLEGLPVPRILDFPQDVVALTLILQPNTLQMPKPGSACAAAAVTRAKPSSPGPAGQAASLQSDAAQEESKVGPGGMLSGTAAMAQGFGGGGSKRASSGAAMPAAASRAPGGVRGPDGGDAAGAAAAADTVAAVSGTPAPTIQRRAASAQNVWKAGCRPASTADAAEGSDAHSSPDAGPASGFCSPQRGIGRRAGPRYVPTALMEPPQPSQPPGLAARRSPLKGRQACVSPLPQRSGTQPAAWAVDSPRARHRRNSSTGAEPSPSLLAEEDSQPPASEAAEERQPGAASRGRRRSPSKTRKPLAMPTSCLSSTRSSWGARDAARAQAASDALRDNTWATPAPAPPASETQPDGPALQGAAPRHGMLLVPCAVSDGAAGATCPCSISSLSSLGRPPRYFGQGPSSTPCRTTAPAPATAAAAAPATALPQAAKSGLEPDAADMALSRYRAATGAAAKVGGGGGSPPPRAAERGAAKPGEEAGEAAAEGGGRAGDEVAEGAEEPQGMQAGEAREVPGETSSSKGAGDSRWLAGRTRASSESALISLPAPAASRRPCMMSEPRAADGTDSGSCSSSPSRAVGSLAAAVLARCEAAPAGVLCMLPQVTASTGGKPQDAEALAAPPPPPSPPQPHELGVEPSEAAAGRRSGSPAPGDDTPPLLTGPEPTQAPSCVGSCMAGLLDGEDPALQHARSSTASRPATGMPCPPPRPRPACLPSVGRDGTCAGHVETEVAGPPPVASAAALPAAPAAPAQHEAADCEPAPAEARALQPPQPRQRLPALMPLPPILPAIRGRAPVRACGDGSMVTHGGQVAPEAEGGDPRRGSCGGESLAAEVVEECVGDGLDDEFDYFDSAHESEAAAAAAAGMARLMRGCGSEAGGKAGAAEAAGAAGQEVPRGEQERGSGNGEAARLQAPPDDACMSAEALALPPTHVLVARAYTPPVIPPSHVAKAMQTAAQPRSGGAAPQGAVQQLSILDAELSGRKEAELDLIFDPILNCYYDARTNQYYALR